MLRGARWRVAAGLGVALLAALAASVDAPAGGAQSCTCEAASADERLGRADAAVVGRISGERETRVRGAVQNLYTVEVLQRVKGDLRDRFVVRSPPACDIFDAAAPPVAEDGTTGLLLTRSPDEVWLASACSVVSPIALVAAGDEPRGTAIKVIIGLLILGLVLSWALRRKARGARPQLPGAPGP